MPSGMQGLKTALVDSAGYRKTLLLLNRGPGQSWPIHTIC